MDVSLRADWTLSGLFLVIQIFSTKHEVWTSTLRVQKVLKKKGQKLGIHKMDFEQWRIGWAKKKFNWNSQGSILWPLYDSISTRTTQWQDVIQEFWPKINLVSLGHRHFKIHILYTNLEHFFFATLDCFPSKSASHIWWGEFWSPKMKLRGSSRLDKCVEFCETKIDFWCVKPAGNELMILPKTSQT